MAAAPRFKVYDPQGKYQAACHEPEAAAVLAEWYGAGSTIRDGHRKRNTLYTFDGKLDSFDAIAEICFDKVWGVMPGAKGGQQ